MGHTGVCAPVPGSSVHLPGHSDGAKDEAQEDSVGANPGTFVGTLKREDLLFPLGQGLLETQSWGKPATTRKQSYCRERTEIDGRPLNVVQASRLNCP